MPLDMVIKNGKFVINGNFIEGGVGIENGVIAVLAKTTRLPDADVVIDAKGNLILPGPIDGHVHIQIPKWCKETFRTGTHAAALGGITTVVEMPSLDEFLTTKLENFEKKRDLGEKECIIDFALYAGEIQYEDDLIDIPKLVDAGAVGFKITMGGDTAYKKEGIFYEALKKIASKDSLATVHAENNNLLEYFLNEAKKLQKAGQMVTYSDSRPNVVEAEAINRAILYSKFTDTRLHIAHMSTKEGVELVRAAKQSGQKVTAEVCPHHLFFSIDDYTKYGHMIITNPPPRTKEDQLRLWEGLRDGDIDLVVTDHCTFTKDVKDAGLEDVFATPPGIPGLEVVVRLMLSEGVNKGRISLTRFIEVMSTNPAKLFGLYPRKGTISVGSDADIIIVDLHKEQTLNIDKLQCADEFSPYAGWIIKGDPVMTIVRGTVIAEDWTVLGKPGYGKFVPSKRH